MHGGGPGIPQEEENPYLEDLLLKSSSGEDVLSHVDTMLHLLNCWGLILNTVKSTLAPTQQTEFIGALLDSTKLKVFLPTDCSRQFNSCA